MARRRPKSRRQSLDPGDVLRTGRSPGLEPLLRLIHQVNPTDRGLEGEQVERRYGRKAGLQSLLIRVHGELPMHNNLSELLLRQCVVGRKNWLFARSEGGAQAAATLYTLIGSCMLQGIDPHGYLVDILDRLPDHPVSRVRELMPREWRLAREDHTAGAG